MSPIDGTWPESGAGSGCLCISTCISVFQCLYPHSPSSVLVGSSLNREDLGGEAQGSRGPSAQWGQRMEVGRGDSWLFPSDLKMQASERGGRSLGWSL